MGATDKSDSHAGFSNTGNHIDVAAPGVNIWSCIPTAPYYELKSGTSMAAPHVSGIAGLLLSKNPGLYNDDVEQIIRLGADDKGPITGWDPEYGTGRVNARKALDLISSPNTVNQWTASGGSSVGNTGKYKMSFYSTPGLATAVYLVKRYDVRKTVNFGQSFQSAPNVWVRGVGTKGYSMTNPNFGMGWGYVVSNNNNSAALQTYVYEVWALRGQYIGWVPTSPSNVTWNYTVLGIPASLKAAVQLEKLTPPAVPGLAQNGSIIPAIPARTRLDQNYPNPLNPETWIPFSLTTKAEVVINIYSLSGELVRVLALGENEPGYYTAKGGLKSAAYWDGKNKAGEEVSSGIYLYQLRAGSFVSTRKMIVLK